MTPGLPWILTALAAAALGASLGAALATRWPLGLARLFGTRASPRAFASEAACGPDHAAVETDRLLGLLAEEMHANGLRLRGTQGRVADAVAAAAIAATAETLLHRADEARELLATHAGPRHLEEESLPLLPLLEEAVAAMAQQLVPTLRQWRLAPELSGLVLLADRRALRGVLVQVLGRAVRMTREADWIELRPVITDESLAIVVEDEGVGLGAEDLAPGADIEAHTRGLCFGLAVARKLLQAHGGELRLESLPGVGARAWLTFPRARLLDR
jgi:signal transduction histidine kinase